MLYNTKQPNNILKNVFAKYCLKVPKDCLNITRYIKAKSRPRIKYDKNIAKIIVKSNKNG